MKLFEFIYNESLVKLTEVGSSQFKYKIENCGRRPHNSGLEYANKFISVQGTDTPINLAGSYKKVINGDESILSGIVHFGHSSEYNRAILECLIEDTAKLLKVDTNDDLIVSFFSGFAMGLVDNGVEIAESDMFRLAA